MQDVTSIHKTKKGAHFLDQRDLAYNSDDFPVPNVVAQPIEISFVQQRFWRICKKKTL